MVNINKRNIVLYLSALSATLLVHLPDDKGRLGGFLPKREFVEIVFLVQRIVMI